MKGRSIAYEFFTCDTIVKKKEKNITSRFTSLRLLSNETRTHFLVENFHHESYPIYTYVVNVSTLFLNLFFFFFVNSIHYKKEPLLHFDHSLSDRY